MTRIHIINHRNYDKYLDWSNYGPFMGIDFDGVLNTYDGSNGYHADYDPDPFAAWFLSKLTSNGYKVIVVTTRRDLRSVIKWLRRYKLGDDIYAVTNLKIPCKCLGDDGVVTHTGNLKELLPKMLNFKRHWEKDAEPSNIIARLQITCPGCNVRFLAEVVILGQYKYVECPFCHAKIGV